MHIAFFSDQHPATLGGLRVSLRLQRDYLERLVHRITVIAPAPRSFQGLANLLRETFSFPPSTRAGIRSLTPANDTPESSMRLLPENPRSTSFTFTLTFGDRGTAIDSRNGTNCQGSTRCTSTCKRVWSA